jgi:uncharacterized protein YjdB
VLTVAAAVLQSIAVTPANPSVPKGQTEQFTATGTFSDNSTQNLTNQVTWASAKPAVATINAAGLATAVSSGTSTISATLSGVTGSTVLTVTAAVLQSIAVTPANPSVAKGQTEQFTATGTFSDNSTQDLTNQVIWASAKPAVATINAAGLATAVDPGTSTISATLNGVTGSTVLTVTAGTASPPTLNKAFADSQIQLSGPSSSTALSFTLSNPNASTSLTGLAFTDTLPSGLIVSTPSGLAGSCGGGTITADPGSHNISLSGATLASGSSCTFSVNVSGTETGVQTNTTSTVSSNEAEDGAPATATTSVVNLFFLWFFLES